MSDPSDPRKEITEALDQDPVFMMSDVVDAIVPLLADRDAKIARLSYERRLLGWARMTLDLVAADDPDRWAQARREAADLAQRIVDEIGHPVTDEPALGPSLRAERDQAEATIARVTALAADLDALAGPDRDWSVRAIDAAAKIRAALAQPGDEPTHEADPQVVDPQWLDRLHTVQSRETDDQIVDQAKQSDAAIEALIEALADIAQYNDQIRREE